MWYAGEPKKTRSPGCGSDTGVTNCRCSSAVRGRLMPTGGRRTACSRTVEARLGARAAVGVHDALVLGGFDPEDAAGGGLRGWSGARSTDRLAKACSTRSGAGSGAGAGAGAGAGEYGLAVAVKPISPKAVWARAAAAGAHRDGTEAVVLVVVVFSGRNWAGWRRPRRARRRRRGRPGLDRGLRRLRDDAGQLGQGVVSTWRAVTASSMVSHVVNLQRLRGELSGSGGGLVRTRPSRPAARPCGLLAWASPQGASENAPEVGPRSCQAVCVEDSV